MKFYRVLLLLLLCSCNKPKREVAETGRFLRHEYPLLAVNDKETILRARYGDEKMPCGKYFNTFKDESGTVYGTATFNESGVKTVTFGITPKNTEVIVDKRYESQPTIERELTPNRLKIIIRIGGEDFQIAQSCLPVDKLAKFKIER